MGVFTRPVHGFKTRSEAEAYVHEMVHPKDCRCGKLHDVLGAGIEQEKDGTFTVNLCIKD
jgi:hypothetical protein